MKKPTAKQQAEAFCNWVKSEIKTGVFSEDRAKELLFGVELLCSWTGWAELKSELEAFRTSAVQKAEAGE